MFIESRKSGYNRDGEQFAHGRFLILMVGEGGDAKKAPGLVRGLVRVVRMRQVGNFMMARLNIKAGGVLHKLSLSGSYGNDGLLKTVPQEVWNLGIDLPQELWHAWNDGGGWNSAGSEAPAMKEWALAAFAPEPKKECSPYPQAKRLNQKQNSEWFNTFRNELGAAVNHHIRNMTTYEQFRLDVKARVWDHPVFRKIQSHLQEFLHGYLSGVRDLIYNHHLEWRMSCDGKLLTKQEINELDKTSPGAWSRIDMNLSTHVWTRDPSRSYNPKA